eukprot:2610661-Pyramimonas_sp.AAC.1
MKILNAIAVNNSPRLCLAELPQWLCPRLTTSIGANPEAERLALRRDDDVPPTGGPAQARYRFEFSTAWRALGQL